MRNYFLMSLIFVAGAVKANNISVSNVTLAGQNVSAGVNNALNYTYIEFDLTWNNSWRTSSAPNNWDAAWVFIKYRTTGSSTWTHVKLAPSGHNSSSTTPTTSYSVQVGLVNESVNHSATTNPAVGAFIYRSADGTGTFSANDIRLKWFYRDNGVGDNDIIDVEVYAIEMVYVPDGSFYVGNNASTSSNINRPFYKIGSPHTNFDITSEASITATGSTGNAGWIAHPEWSSNNQNTVSADFPKGYKGFYCMKYETSQQQWVDFLNSLTASQQANLPTAAYSRNGISSSSGVFSTTLPFVAMNSLNWADVASFLDWAGLRVMTELEFEKACRGTSTPVTEEFAWGNTSYTSHATTITNGGLTNEVSAASGANTNLTVTTNPGSSPLRVGSFATSSSSRTQSGASFYGIMDMSGNVSEQVATMINYQATTTSYTGIHGNGELTSSGYADVSNWPGLVSGFISSAGILASATACRGGGWYNNGAFSAASVGKVADRAYSQLSVPPTSSRTDVANIDRGARGVHTKPITASETK
jgi:hypothetical protein